MAKSFTIEFTYDLEVKSEYGFSGKKVNGRIHRVSTIHGIKGEVHLYDRLLKNDGY